MDGLRAFRGAGAATKDGQVRPEVRRAYEIMVPATAGPALRTVPLTALVAVV
ncbi:hypothetical protein PYK79_43520 [Streptomyces sp. ID05-04B]|uniref:hypothetical protein n=1 Tax=unclassified Streptomyces TaxID=2593676 RepID=UPI00131EE86F|nr:MULTISPECIES: hypothetical protein [unclassified Streptomyces]MDX5568807.1 hypothetical protein [Streptomyces sp. ID05-04B]